MNGNKTILKFIFSYRNIFLFLKFIYFQFEVLGKQVDLLIEEDKEKLDVLERMATILKSCYMQLKGHGFVTEALTKQYTKIIQDFQGKKNVKFHDIPDSGISSTTSITEDENKTNNNKRKIEEPPVELDGTFTMTNVSTPSKPKSKGTGAEQIISKGGIGYNFFGGLASELIHGVFYSVNLKKN